MQSRERCAREVSSRPLDEQATPYLWGPCIAILVFAGLGIPLQWRLHKKAQEHLRAGSKCFGSQKAATNAKELR